MAAPCGGARRRGGVPRPRRLPDRRAAYSVRKRQRFRCLLNIADPKAPIAEKVAALHSEAGLATILDGIGEGFYAVDCDWRIILFNDEAAQHFGRRPQDVLGRVLWDVFPG